MTARVRGSGGIVITVAVLAAFVSFLDGSIVTVALPAMERELGDGVLLQQWVVDAYLLTLGALILLAGSLSDLFGRIRVLRAGLLGFGITSLACAVAPTALTLILARGLQGAAAALLVPSALALITARFEGPEQSKAIGTWTAWTSVANVVGPLLGGGLVDTVGWRWIFGINVLPIVVTLVLLRRVEADPVVEHRVRLDLPGAVLVSLGLAGTVFGLIEQGRHGVGSVLVWLPFTLGLLLLVAFVAWERGRPEALVPLEIFRRRNFGIGNLATAVIYAALSLGFFALPIVVQELAGYSALQAGLLLLPVTMLLLLLSSFFGRASGRFGPRWFMTGGPAIAGAGFLLVALSLQHPLDPLLQILPGTLVFGLGLAVTVAPLTSAILGAIGGARSGIASAVNNAVSRIGGLLAIAAAGTLLGDPVSVEGLRDVLLVCAALLGVGAVISALGIVNPPSRSGERG